MGWGDDLIATSIAKKAKLKHPDRPICIGDGHNIYWSEVFNHNPKISKEITKDSLWVRNFPGFRPYISKIIEDRYIFNETFKVEPGEIYFSPEELRHTESDFVYIEPNVKGLLGFNKDWGFDNWQKVVDLLPDVRFVQGSGNRLKNVLQVDTNSFRDAAALLSRAFLFVGTDGGLHHASAALNKPAVVVWTGFSPSKVLGYESHINLQVKTRACGRFSECSHCREAANGITVEKVVESILRFIPETSDV